MRKLSEKEIEKFATLPNAQRNIVREILSTVNPDSSTDIRDLFFAAKMQGWTRETITAILSGIACAATQRSSVLGKANSAESIRKRIVKVTPTNKLPPLSLPGQRPLQFDKRETGTPA